MAGRYKHTEDVLDRLEQYVDDLEVFERNEDHQRRLDAVDSAPLERRQHFEERHGRRRRAQALHGLDLHVAGQHANLQPLVIGDLADGPRA